jgi:hypothetical protein
MNRPRTVPYLVGGAIIVVFCLLFRAAERGLHGFSINHAIDPVGLATLGLSASTFSLHSFCNTTLPPESLMIERRRTF